MLVIHKYFAECSDWFTVLLLSVVICQSNLHTLFLWHTNDNHYTIETALRFPIRFGLFDLM